MSFKCKVGIHNWDGCTCKDCGATRDEHHDLAADCEKCAKCGKEFPDNHDWSKNCEVCSKCGATRENAHYWGDNCEKCSSCGEERHNMHQIENGVCKICGHGTFVDEDHKKYKIIRIGENLLMAENYAKKVSEGNFWVYADKSDNLHTDGYLYDFETAKAIAPKGWHLPTKEEWESVCESAGGHTNRAYSNLKPDGHTGFDVKFCGYRSPKGSYMGKNASAHFWTNSIINENKTWQFEIEAYKHYLDYKEADKASGYSVRYFKDKD